MSADYFVDLDCEKYDGNLIVHEKRIGPTNGPVIYLLSHLCHPAQFNDGLIGVVLNVYLSKYIEKYMPNVRHCYSFLALPETIGAHAYCSDPQNVKNGQFAIFCEMVGLDQPFHIQQSKSNDDYVNRVIYTALRETKFDAKFSDFLKVIRNDEKVFNAPGINIPAASITRALGPGIEHHPFYGYHTDLDDIENANIPKLKEALILYQTILNVIENDFWIERCFSGIPMLSRHGLFIEPSVDIQGYNLREGIAHGLHEEKMVSELAFDLDAPFTEVLNILVEWEKCGLVRLREG